MSKATINLEQYRSYDPARKIKSKVFTGRDRGKKVREQSRIDAIETQNDHIDILVPEDIYSINPSFLEEFLFNVVKKLGKDAFLAKFNIVCLGEYKCDNQLNEAIERIVRGNTAIDEI